VRPLSTVEEGARAIFNLATSPADEGQTGLYFNELHETKAQAQTYDRKCASAAPGAKSGAHRPFR